MNQQDLTYQATANGYTIFYKGKSIGGAGVILPRRKPLHYTHARANVKMFGENARAEIRSLLDGRGRADMRTALSEIATQEAR